MPELSPGYYGDIHGRRIKMRTATTFKREIEINRPVKKVWETIADFGNISHENPAVVESFVTSAQKQGVGATRHSDFTRINAAAEEKVVAWKEGQSVKTEAYALRRMPGIARMAMEFSVREKGDHAILTGTMEYSMKNPLYDLVNQLVMKHRNEKLFDRIMAGHKKYIETGDIVYEKTPLDLEAVAKLH